MTPRTSPSPLRVLALCLAAVASHPCPPVASADVARAEAGERPLSEDIARLDVIEADLRVADLTDERRAALVREADAMRAGLIERAPSDDRAPTWMVDRAATALAELSREDLDLTVLVGLASERERTSVRVAAAKALELLQRATRVSGTAIAALESDALSRPGTAEAADRQLARLIEVEQAQRIPFFTGLAHGLLAGAAATESERTAAATSAVKSLEAVSVRSAAIEPARDAIIALALINASNTPSERAFGVARDRLRRALEHPAAEPATRRRAALGLAVIGQPVDPAENAAPSGPDPLLLEAQARGHLLRDGRLGRLTTLAGPVADLLKQQSAPRPGEDRPAADARRVRVYAKLAPQVDPRAARDAVAPELLLARAITMLRDRATAHRDAALLLDHVAQRADAPPALRADALWELAAATRDSDPAGSARALGRLVREAPASERVVDAARLLADDGAANAAARRDAVRVLLERTSEPRWGQVAVAIERTDTALDEAARITAAVRVFDGLDGPRRDAAAGELAKAAAALVEQWEQMPATSRSGVADDLLSRLTPTAPGVAARAGLDIGEREVRAGAHASAERRLLALLGSTIDRPGTGEAARLRLNLAEAQAALARTDDAFATLRGLADQFEKPAGAVGRDPPYWAAWARMLELFALDTSGPVDAEALGVHLARLEIIDPALGGAEFATRFARLKEVVSRARAAAQPAVPPSPGTP